MKIYIQQNSVLMAGKAWEIKAKLQEAKKSFQTVQQWVDTVHSTNSRPTRNASATAKKKIGSASNLRPIV